MLLPTIVVVAASSAFVRGGEFCKSVEPLKDFQPDKLNGVWYGTARDNDEWDYQLKCKRFNITSDDVPGALHLQANAVRSDDNEPRSFNVIMKYVQDPTVASFETHVPEIHSEDTISEEMVATDYATYQIYYCCNDEGDNKYEYSWILTKERVVSDDFFAQLESIAKDLGIHSDKLTREDQTDCRN